MALECPSCNNRRDHGDAKFCSNCGTEYPKEIKLPFVGVYKGQGIFRITFAPVEEEFDCEDSANDAARHSAWNEDSEFTEWKIERVRDATTVESHPFICGSCQNTVTDNTNGRCSECGEVNWQPRQ